MEFLLISSKTDKEHLQDRDRIVYGMRSAVSVERRVAIALWRLASNGDYRSIGHMFGVAK